MAVKKWMQGMLGSLGRMDTMLPVVQKPPESMQMPLGLSRRMDIITSAVIEPEARDSADAGGEDGYCRLPLKYMTLVVAMLRHCKAFKPPLVTQLSSLPYADVR